MKPRRVVISIELDTDIKIDLLKRAIDNLFAGVPRPLFNLTGRLELIQIQANVVK